MNKELRRAEALPAALQHPISIALLESRVPARLAWVSARGVPRVVPIWHHWTGERLELATFVGSTKLSELSDGDRVAVTIDTDQFPYRGLKLGGPVTVRSVDGLAPAYREAAVRYLGPTTAARWLDHLEGRDQAVLALRPTWATVSDLADSPFVRGDLATVR